MKNNFLFTAAFLLIIIYGQRVEAQITNFTLNGFSSDFNIVQGSGMRWEFNLPVGGTAVCEIWIDINANGFIEPATDKSVFGSFTQTDGDLTGQNGPGDMDSTVNGHCLLDIPEFMLAPAKYILRFSNNNVSTILKGTVTAMLSPAYTISGHVSVLPGINPENIIVSAEGRDAKNYQSLALTNASGNFTLNYTQGALGIVFKVRVNDNLPPYIVSPSDTTVTLLASLTNINFVFQQPAAKVTGYFKGEDGTVFANMEIDSWTENQGGDKRAFTDANGFFQLGYSQKELNSSSTWSLQGGSSVIPAYVSPQYRNLTIHQNDSIRVNLTALIANDSITGRITIDGLAPGGNSFGVYASGQDTGYTYANTNPVTGNFTLHVSKKIFNYNLGMNNLPEKYGLDWEYQQIHPGAKNILLKIITLQWQPQSEPTGNSLKSVFFANQSVGWAAGANGTLLATTDAGNTWSQKNSGTSSNINSLFFTDALTGWLAGNSGIIRKTTDGGNTWLTENSTTTLDIYAIQFISPLIGWAAGGNYSGQALILKTTDGGSNWSSAQGISAQGPVRALSMINANTGWVLCGGLLYKTLNGGAQWDLQPVPSSYMNGIKFADANNGWAVGEGNVVYTTHDGGTNWDIQYTATCNLRAVYCINAMTAWAVGDCKGIVRTTDGGNTWVKQLTNNMNGGNLYSVFFTDTRNGWAVGDNGSILHTWTGGAAGVNEQAAGIIPSSPALEQNYPNPFNPGTTISFVLSERSEIALTVYDQLGRKVSALFSGEKPAGRHQLYWDATGLSSGIYFYELRTSSSILVKKLVLMK